MNVVVKKSIANVSRHSCLLPFLKVVKTIVQRLWQFQSRKCTSLKTLHATESDSPLTFSESFKYGRGSLNSIENTISSYSFGKVHL